MNIWFISIAYIIQGCRKEWGLSTLAMGVIASFYPLGLLVGSILWGVISDKYGRMYAFKNTALVSTIASICLVFSVNYQMVAACLFVLGAGIIGELTVGSTVFFEFCPPSHRKYLSLLSVFTGMGGVSISITALIIAITNSSSINDWRYIVGYGTICEVVTFIFRYFMTETPVFYVSKGNYEKAQQVLNMISLKNSGKEFVFNDDDLRLSGIYEIENKSVNSQRNESLLGKESRNSFWKNICVAKFLKTCSNLSLV